ncbi:PadR family transcriptional regulator [Salinicoccus sesuvii]|uniref:PadR family transcriptional regulator n=1 Tax=Salinicoccus sesuvii TaxID=868281 RepID=A0ABV7N597_9STAP
MNTQLKKGSLEMCVLRFIHKEDQYGYQLAQNVSAYFSIAEGTLYPLLRRLVKIGYLNTYFQESNEGPARKYYTLTESGIERMHALVEEWQIYSAAVNNILADTK